MFPRCYLRNMTSLLAVDSTVKDETYYLALSRASDARQQHLGVLREFFDKRYGGLYNTVHFGFRNISFQEFNFQPFDRTIDM